VWAAFKEDPEAAQLLKDAGIDAAEALATGASESGVDIVSTLLGMDTGGEEPVMDGAVLAEKLVTPLATAFSTFQTGGLATFMDTMKTGWSEVSDVTQEYWDTDLANVLNVGITPTRDAGKAMLDAFEEGFEKAATKASTFNQKLKNIKSTWDSIKSKTITLTIKVNREGGGGSGGGGSDPTTPGTYPGYGGSGGLPFAVGQHGLDMIVPSGYSNDTFPVYASSHERVIVMTPQQQAAANRMITVGPNYINNGMDLAALDYHIRSVVGGDFE
jgi:hypothetical protein